ncbi:zinc finger BED domain-containing protein RICESLEEPER 2-like protein [Tanacetum coccineum]
MDDGDDLEDASSSTTSKQFSNVWEYFEIIPVVGPDGIKRATCTHCKKVLLYEHGTSNIRRHIRKCFGVDLNNKAIAPPPKRICLDQAKFREKLAVSIIKHNYPFSYVEHEGTRDLHTFLHPDANPICRNTVKKEVLSIYEREKLKIKRELEKIKGRICLTSDLWRSVTSDGYMTLTAHYIDESWVLRKKVLNFRVIPPPHMGSLLAHNLHVPLDEIRIDKTLRFVEEPLEILDREVKSLKRSRIPIVKVRLNSKCGPEFTWEREDYMKVKYPQLLVKNTSEPSV